MLFEPYVRFHIFIYVRVTEWPPIGWLVDWGLTSHQQLRSYGDGTSVYSPIRRTGEAREWPPIGK